MLGESEGTQLLYPERLTIPSRGAKTEKASDVSPSSIHSYRSKNRFRTSCMALTDRVLHPKNGSDNDNIRGQLEQAHSGNTNGTSATLSDQLWAAKIEWPEGKHQYFIPIDKLHQIITSKSILDEIRKYRRYKTENDLEDYAKKIQRKAYKLFSILVSIGKGEAILSFIEEGLIDKDLPFIRHIDPAIEAQKPKNGHYKLCSNRFPDRQLQCMEHWEIRLIHDFSTCQWWSLAPIFRSAKGGNVRHYDLKDNCVLPYIEDQERSENENTGGFGSVWGVKMHPAHQTIYTCINKKVTNLFQ